MQRRCSSAFYSYKISIKVSSVYDLSISHAGNLNVKRLNWFYMIARSIRNQSYEWSEEGELISSKKFNYFSLHLLVCLAINYTNQIIANTNLKLTAPIIEQTSWNVHKRICNVKSTFGFTLIFIKRSRIGEKTKFRNFLTSRIYHFLLCKEGDKMIYRFHSIIFALYMPD